MATGDSNRDEDDLDDFLHRADPEKLFLRWEEAYLAGRLLSTKDLCREVGLDCPSVLETGLQEQLDKRRAKIESEIEDCVDDWEAEYEKGNDIAVEQLRPLHPERWEVLRKAVTARRNVIAAVRPLRDMEAGSPLRPGYRPIPGSDWVLQKPLRTSGFGKVWKAYNRNLDQFAVFKFASATWKSKESLENEIRLLGRIRSELNHDGIVQLQGEHLTDAIPFLQYEYVDGDDLAAVIEEEGRFPPLEAASIVLRLSEVVGFAHALAKPIVHRDLKPSNVLVRFSGGVPQVLPKERKADAKTGKLLVVTDSNGPRLVFIGDPEASPLPLSGAAQTKAPIERVPLLSRAQFKVTDFGIGAVVNRTPIIGETTARGQDFSGSGTAPYASWEQIHGEPASPADDVYALGVIWYELLTGETGRGGPTALWKDELIGLGVPATHVAVMGRCLDRRSRRIPDARLLADDIRAVLKAEIRQDMASSDKELMNLFLDMRVDLDWEQLQSHQGELRRALAARKARTSPDQTAPEDESFTKACPVPLSDDLKRKITDHLWLWKDFAEDGDADAQCLYGACGIHPYVTGLHKTPTFSFLRRSAEEKCGLAAYLYAVALHRAWRQGKAAPAPQEEVLRWMAVAADAGHEEALMNLGCLYMTGRAKGYICSNTQHRLTGLTCGRDLVRADKWFRKGHEAGESKFTFELAKVQGPITERIKLFEQAVREARDGRAALAIALYYADEDFFDQQCGIHVPLPEVFQPPKLSIIPSLKDSDRAAKWFTTAAEQGEPAAKAVLGFMYRGAGDTRRAVEFLRQVGQYPAWLIDGDLAWEVADDDVHRLCVGGYANLILAQLLLQRPSLDECDRAEAVRALKTALADDCDHSWLHRRLYVRCHEEELMGDGLNPSRWFRLGEMIAMIDGDGSVKREIKEAAVQDADLSFAFGCYYLALEKYQYEDCGWIAKHRHAARVETVKEFGRRVGYVYPGEWFWRAKELGHPKARQVFEGEESAEAITRGLVSKADGLL